jgi:sodium-dependent dicarboxylate transporter 2/3/5
LTGLGVLPVVLLVAGVAGVVLALTELTRNTATAATFLPVLGPVAVELGHGPLLLAAPAALAARCAFMLPVATPPNALVFGSGQLEMPDMVQAGVGPDVAFLVLVTVATFTLVPWALGGGPG